MNGEHQSRRFRLNREIIRTSARNSPGAIAPLAKLSSARRAARKADVSLGLLWYRTRETERGLMKPKVETEGRLREGGWKRMVARAFPLRRLAESAAGLGCLFAGSFLDRGISSRSSRERERETAKNSSRRLIVVVFFPGRR